MDFWLAVFSGAAKKDQPRKVAKASKTPNKGRGSRGEKEEEAISKDEGEGTILFLKTIREREEEIERQREGVVVG